MGTARRRALGALALVGIVIGGLDGGARISAAPPPDPTPMSTRVAPSADTAPSPVAPPAAAALNALNWFGLAGPYASATPAVLPDGSLLVQVTESGDPYVHRGNAGAWSGPLAAGGRFTSAVVPAEGLNQAQPPTAQLFGVGLDGAMWYRTDSTSWQSLGGGFRFSPHPVVFGGVTYVFGVGLDGAVWYRTLTTGWASLGGYVNSDPAITTDGTSLYVVARGGDDGMWSRRMTGQSWAPWQSLGGLSLSYPAATFLFDAGYVFIIGRDGAVWQARVQAGAWTGWQWLDGLATTAPGASTDSNGGINVFIVGGDLAMYTRRLTAAGWSPWRGLGGAFDWAPDASGTQVFAVGLDGWLYGATFT